MRPFCAVAGGVGAVSGVAGVAAGAVGSVAGAAQVAAGAGAHFVLQPNSPPPQAEAG